MTCDPWDAVIVPFPFTEKAGAKRRPALVLSTRDFNENGHTVLAMVTTKSHSPWPGDILIEDLSTPGLHTPRIVHAHGVRLQRHLTKGIAELAYLEYLQADS